MRHSARPPLRRLVTGWLAVAVAVALLPWEGRHAQAADAVPAGSAPVLVVHGYSRADCPGNDVTHDQAGGVYLQLKNAGWTGPVLPVSYYACDTDGVDITGYGPAVPDGATPTITAAAPRIPYTQQTSIEQIAHDLAWFVYLTYSRAGTPVDLVGHSMGGLLIRDALYRVQAGDPAFPPFLLVDHALTLSTPHAGFQTTAENMTWCSGLTECLEFATDSAFIADLQANGSNPQGQGGTQWTVVGSSAGCDVVPAASTLAMPAARRVDYTSPCYGHTDYLWDFATTTDAQASVREPGATATVTANVPHSLSLVLESLGGVASAPTDSGSPASSSVAASSTSAVPSTPAESSTSAAAPATTTPASGTPTVTTPAAQQALPAAPPDLAAGPLTGGTVHLSWAPPADPSATGFAVHVSTTAGSPGPALATLPAGATTWTSPAYADGTRLFLSVATLSLAAAGAPGPQVSSVADARAPTVRVAAPATLAQLSSSVRVTYGARDDVTGVATYDVDYRAASWNGALGPWHPLRSATTSTSATIAGKAGREYCVRVRARDRAGNLSAWTGARCTSVALDDRALSANSSWQRGTRSGYYRSTWTGTSTAGATLHLAGAYGSRLAMVMTTCASCGSVQIFVDGHSIQTISTRSTTTHRQVLVLSPRFRLARHTVALRAVSAGRAVRIDGLAVLQ